MTDDEAYMVDFMRVYEPLERWGPGSDADTLKALSFVPFHPTRLLEIGCGHGLATTVLLQHTDARVSAVDTEASALERLIARFEAGSPEADRLETLCASMTDLSLPAASFDLIWAEGSAYIMGVEDALRAWKPLLRDDGVLVLSDMVWRVDTPSETATAFWRREYPDLQTVQTRLRQAEQCGYTVLAHFEQSKTAWSNYYAPLAERVAALETEMPRSAALQDIKTEVDIAAQHADAFGYHFFILRAARAESSSEKR